MATKDERLQYGFGSDFLKTHGAVRRLVDKAVDQEYTMQRFLDELRGTPWWKNKSDAQRRYELNKTQNPGQLQSDVRTAKKSVQNLSVKLGVYLSSAQISNIATSWVRNDMSESEIQDLIGRKYQPRRTGTSLARGHMGVAGAARAQLNEMAMNYGMKFSGKWLNSAARNVARGRRSVSDYEGFVRRRAQATFKAISADIQEGRTVREILDPYIQVAADELGLAPSTFNTTGAKWLKPISGKEQMSMDDWVRTIRSNKSYGYDRSRNATRQASIMAREMMSTMGAQ